ncbi:hypothetical protein [Paenibacillus apiarius]|uniref:Uncharacterized protein n=1 Tax=Paenibacillus apiarius TaxID=46240 RepID=A0ABT4DVR9_9BACL|nr:hypothetical protein [Paenibacillus apiarius]MCY9513202.1 hypothetical protein [Paenibacillus apiarius]MCY9521439.1 hypothetical protein [Paenibacillus apiarius]MCY9554415.1 hypothetical protein [Paenibacillus apiarius]MCY9560618.1 hypothetical protein [Paenibacillus apiarius]MCY9685131.1 hypothetical protein [Paenibacillus apiarius]
MISRTANLLIYAKSTQTILEYDLLGRPTAVFEQREGMEIPQYRDRFIYGEKEADTRQFARTVGAPLRYRSHIQTDSFSLAGMPLH